MTDRRDDNDYITIPVPLPVARARGVLAHSKALTPVRFRINDIDRRLVKEEADLLGVKEVPFYRWCAIYVARELRRRRTGEVPAVDP